MGVNNMARQAAGSVLLGRQACPGLCQTPAAWAPHRRSEEMFGRESGTSSPLARGAAASDIPPAEKVRPLAAASLPAPLAAGASPGKG